MATIYEVAKLAGVSTASVSRVFNGNIVSPEKERLVPGLPQLNAPERMQKAGAEHETGRRMGPRSALT